MVGAAVSGWRDLSIWAEACADRATRWLEATLLQLPGQAQTVKACVEGYAAVLGGARLGSRYACGALLQGIVQQTMVSPGEFHALDEPAKARERSFLRNSCLLLAASQLGRVDVLSEPALVRLRSYQHGSGGFFDMDPAQGHGLVEAFTTAWGGRVAIRFGWHEQARRAARLLADIIHLQPDPAGRFYFCYDTASRALATRWRPNQPAARFVEYESPAGETHHLGMMLAFLCEMHLADPGGGWDRAAAESLSLLQRCGTVLFGLPAMGTVAEGLALAALALGKAGQAAAEMLQPQVASLSATLEACGAAPAWDAGIGGEYERAYSTIESTGWTAVCLAGLAQTCAALSS